MFELKYKNSHKFTIIFLLSVFIEISPPFRRYIIPFISVIPDLYEDRPRHKLRTLPFLQVLRFRFLKLLLSPLRMNNLNFFIQK